MEQNIQTNPLVEKRKRALPGVTFRIPSRGEIYQPGVLAEHVVDGEVLVYPMRLREELKMKSLDSIFQGSAVSETVSYCVPDVLKPELLCPTDIDYLMTAIKKQTHGDNFRYKDICMKIEKMVDRSKVLEETAVEEFEELQRSPEPESNLDNISEQLRTLDNAVDDTNGEAEGKEERPFDPVLDNVNNLGTISKFCEFDIPLSHFIDTVKELDPEIYEEKKRFEFMGFDIELQQISFNSFKEISNLRLKENPEEMAENQYFDYINKFSNINIARRIRLVDNISDQTQIEEWVDSFNLDERIKLLGTITSAYDWGINFDYTLSCSSCGKTKKLDMSYLNPLYFFLTY